MRRTANKRPHDSTHSAKLARKFDARRSVEELRERVSKLEQLFGAIKETGGFGFENATPPRKQPGPKPVHGWAIRSDRDQLVRMLEDFWPEIEPFCSPRVDAEGLRRVLLGVARTLLGRHERPARHLIKSLPEVVKFLSGDRFRNDPRQLANAFAGFPGVSTWRSLKICQSYPCKDPIGNRAIRAYIRRKHPAFHEELERRRDLINFVNASKRYRSKDQNLRGYRADILLKCWHEGVPNYASLKPPTSK